MRLKIEDEERERIKQKKLAEEEAQYLLNRLKQIEIEEAERLKKRKYKQLQHESETAHMAAIRRSRMNAEDMSIIKRNQKPQEMTVNTSTDYEPFLQTDEDQFMQQSIIEDELLGISEEELDKQCDELFAEVPIRFKPRRENQMDMLIDEYIRELEINIPIIWIKGQLYLIGSQRITCQLKNDQLLCRVGGGYETF